MTFPHQLVDIVITKVLLPGEFSNMITMSSFSPKILFIKVLNLIFYPISS